MKPFIISVTGAHSGCGKTAVAEAIIRGIGIRWGAVKCTRTDLYESLSDEVGDGPPGKDTVRLRQAGARPVIWIQAPPEGLSGLLETALGQLGECDGAVVEGNSPAGIIAPDVIVFVFGDDPEEVKPSARPLIGKADYILRPGGAPSGGAGVYDPRSASGIQGLINDIIIRFSLKRGVPQGQHTRPGGPEGRDHMDRTAEIEQRLSAGATDARISCTLARKIAEDLGVGYREVGDAADRLKIRIRNCELGCF